MARKFLGVDTETTQTGKVFDIGLAGWSGSKLKVLGSKGYIIQEVWDDINVGNDMLFCSGQLGDFGTKTLAKRMGWYERALIKGTRTLISREALQRMFDKWYAEGFIFTAYNVPFDWGKLQDTGIFLAEDWEKYDIWTTFQNYLLTHKGTLKKYWYQSVATHDNKTCRVTPRLTIRTDANSATQFCSGYMLAPEPHKALEDLIYYEKMVLAWLLKRGVKADNQAVYWDKLHLATLLDIKDHKLAQNGEF